MNVTTATVINLTDISCTVRPNGARWGGPQTELTKIALSANISLLAGQHATFNYNDACIIYLYS
jgi:hypothetical protein